MLNRLIEAAIFTAVGLPLCALMSYGLALAGEPQAVWLWRDVLGVL